MRSYLLGPAIALVLAADLSLAQTYRSEIDLAYTRMEIIDSPDHVGAVRGTYYFSPVKTANHPLAEAAFLEKANNVSLSYSHRDGDQSYSYGSYRHEASYTQEVINADVEIFIPNSIFYIAAGVTRHDVESRFTVSSLNTDGTTDIELPTQQASNRDSSWHGSLGITPVEGLLVWSTFYEDVDLDDHWNLNAKYVFDWSGNAVNIEGDYRNNANYDSFSIISDYYFDSSFSIGAGYNYVDTSAVDDSFLLRTRKFFTENVSINAEYITDDSVDIYTLGISLRF